MRLINTIFPSNHQHVNIWWTISRALILRTAGSNVFLTKNSGRKKMGLWKFSKVLWFPHRLPKEITAQERFSHWLFCTIFLKQKNLLKLCKKVASGLSTSFFQKILTFFRGNSEKRSSDGKQQLLVCTNPQTSFVASLYFCFNTRGRIRVRFLIFFVL